MITDIKTEIKDGYLFAIIDDATIPFTVEEIIKKDTHIINNRLINTTLYELINIQMYIYAFYKENISKNLDEITKDDAELIEQGNVLITIENENKKYYEKRIAFRNGLIQTTIPEKLPLGDYILTVKYDGNKYYKETIYKAYFTISKRKIVCEFGDFSWEAYPDDEVEIEALFKDKLNKKGINNINVIYYFAGRQYVTRTNHIGYATIRVKMPSVSECSQDAVAYPLELEIDNEVYIFEGITKYISVIKYETYMKILSGIREQINHLQLEGNIVNENADNVRCGQIFASIDNTNITLENNSFIVNNGVFSNYLTLFTLQEYDDSITNKQGYFFEQENSNTITTLTINDINTTKDGELVKIIRSYEDNHYINFEVEVLEDSTEIPAEGMVSFVINENKNNNTIRKEVYRYVAELDNDGKAYFNFYVSKDGDFDIQVFYHESFFFYKSESDIQYYRVEKEGEN